MSADALYLVVVLVSLTVVTGLVLETTWESGEKAYGSIRRRRNRRALMAALPEVVKEAVVSREKTKWLPAWHRYVGQQLEKSDWHIQPAVFVVISVGLALLGVTVAYAVSKDVFVAMTAAVMLVFLPFSLLNMAVQRRTQEILEQLPTAVQLFAVEFEMSKNVKEALMRSSEGVGDPLRKYLRECAASLGAGKRPRDAFRKLADDLNCEYGRLWTQMLFAATEDASVVKMVPRLTDRLSKQRLLMQKNITELSGERRIGILLNILVLPGFVAVQAFFPDSIEFFSTPFGKLAIIFIFLSVVIGIMLDQLLSKVDF